MGLILNTPATIEMTEKVNRLFSSTYIGWWRQSPQKNWFCGETTKKALHDIAAAVRLFPDSGENSNEGKNWFKWLKFMNKGVAPTPATQIVSCICEALDDDPACMEIIFVVVPTSSTQATVTCSQVGTSSSYSKVITVATPDVNTMSRHFATRTRAIARKRSARKKKR